MGERGGEGRERDIRVGENRCEGETSSGQWRGMGTGKVWWKKRRGNGGEKWEGSTQMEGRQMTEYDNPRRCLTFLYPVHRD
jgi:hypothetical protein